MGKPASLNSSHSSGLFLLSSSNGSSLYGLAQTSQPTRICYRSPNTIHTHITLLYQMYPRSLLTPPITHFTPYCCYGMNDTSRAYNAETTQDYNLQSAGQVLHRTDNRSVYHRPALRLLASGRCRDLFHEIV